MRLLAAAGAIGLIATATACTRERRPFEDVATADRRAPEAQPVGEQLPPTPQPVVVAPAERPPVVGPLTRPVDVATERIPMVYDGHGALIREWPTAVIYRASGNVIAGAYYWPSIDLSERRPMWQSALFEPGEFLLNTVLLPVRAYQTPPWQDVIYSPVGPAEDERYLIGQPWLSLPAEERPVIDAARIRENGGQ